ncbi:NAD-dependent succinate-semialdehyde dehydrogenase [Ohtaekwangia koreensis]|uniref:Succinate-semialdehyde dehydrogenase / glutarate-semialdehyde dehydrogenase n=1 Tax=Ohtaekwangia koreensis TaxID=688867 RepID=A0A1T5MM84_9BACT|nr:NAD-dependent succinate-semialdehyde dehydrogenase [Ohtaekwangia koreensis]SKC89322.1 succinate-semialdehyde dehydrogenase / glutarate-semialdehyde dehydrogenase [Ohtaekwangia koreensis]
MLKSIHPFDQSVIDEFPLHTPHDIQAKLDKASLAFSLWKKTTLVQRSEMMLRVAAVLRKNKEEYARTITWEMGKVISESRAEIEKCAVGCEYFAKHAENFLADKRIDTDAYKSLVAYQPIGAVLAIMPWNFPFWQVFRYAAPALMAGNVGLLKHSSNVTKCSMTIEKIFHEAGFPDGVFQSLIIQNTAIESILESRIVQGVALTGSESAGAKVGALAGKNIKKSVLELGGSDPFIVLEDADLDLTVKVATQSRMQNAGQSCIAAKRFIVHEKIKEEFVERFRISIEALRQGNPFDEKITTGPLARIDLAEDLEKQLKQSIQQGARIVTGGERNEGNFQPALLDHVKPGIIAFDEETFGPLAAVTSACSEQEAIAFANASRYGLGASIWTTDRDRGERVAREVEAGSVFINSLMKSDVRLPFGGIKKSGYGRELSEEGIHEFVNIKTISIA